MMYWALTFSFPVLSAISGGVLRKHEPCSQYWLALSAAHKTIADSPWQSLHLPSSRNPQRSISSHLLWRDLSLQRYLIWRRCVVQQQPEKLCLPLQLRVRFSPHQSRSASAGFETLPIPIYQRHLPAARQWTEISVPVTIWTKRQKLAEWPLDRCNTIHTLFVQMFRTLEQEW